MNETRVLITGYGSVLPEEEINGYRIPLAALNENGNEHLREPVRRVDLIESDKYIPENELRRMDRLTQFAMLSTLKSIENAQLEIGLGNADRMGIIFNSCFGPLESTIKYLTKLLAQGPKYAPAGLFPFTVSGVFTGVVTMNIQVKGTNSTISGASSICYAADVIRQNTDDVMIAGGCDENVPEVTVWCERMRSLGDRCFCISEGSAAVVLESGDHAIARGANVLAEILQYAVAHDAEPEKPYRFSADAIEHVLRRALKASKVEAKDVDFIVSAANGIEALRSVESSAIARVFCDRPSLPVYRTGKELGETFGAADVHATIAAARLLSSETNNSVEIGGAGIAVVLNYEFGGNIECAVIRRYE